MGRAKLRLELISNEKKRRSTFEKRRKGLEKKADELSTLCGVKIAMILYGHEKEPIVWPKNNKNDVSFLIESYKSGHDRKSRTYSLSTFFKDQTEKVEEELEKVSKKRKEVTYPKWDERYNSLSREELKQFAGILSKKIEAGKEMLNLIKDSKKFNFGTELMNPLSVQEKTIFMPSSSTMQCNSELQDMIQWQQPLPYFDAQTSTVTPNQMDWMMMPMNVGIGNSVQMQSTPLGFHENFSNYAKFPVQNFETMENVRRANDETLMYDNAFLGDTMPVGLANDAPLIMYDGGLGLQGDATLEGLVEAEFRKYNNLCFNDRV